MANNKSNNSYVQIDYGNYFHYITLDTLILMMWWCDNVFIPAICVLGFAGNVITFIVLRKCGLEQSSNILLFCLAVADMLCLLDILTLEFLNERKFFNNRGVRMYLEMLLAAVAETVVVFLTQVGFRASTYITVCIAVERLIAVFYPLHFSTLVTPKRIWLAGLSTFLMWIPWVIYINARERPFRYYVDNNNTKLIGQELYDVLETNIVYRTLRLKVFPNFTHTIPFIFVTIGSVVISLKMAIALRKRQRMTTALGVQKSSARTTRTLLLVCLVFSITHAAYSVTTIYEPERMDRWFTVFYAFAVVRQAFVYANSSFNCVIYIVFNKKFSLIFKSLFHFSTTKVQTSKLALEKLSNKY